MKIIQNPLHAYLVWLVKADTEWADTIASDFFLACNKIEETIKLLDISKESYLSQLKAFSDYLNAATNENDQELPIPKLEWENEDFDYGDEDDDEFPRSLERLTALIIKIVELDSRTHIVSLSQQLFYHTDDMLYSFTSRKGPRIVTDWFKNEYAKHLLEGDSEKAAAAQMELHLLEESDRALVLTKQSWDVLIREGFNRQLICDYDWWRLQGEF